MRKLDDSKFCFISCVNDDFMYKECQFYLQHLNVPQRMSVEILDVRGAASMTAGYQAAMEASDARYKIYLHQDVFVVNKDILHELLRLFSHNPQIGMIGVAGATTLNADRPIWWESNSMCGKVYSKRYTEAIQLESFGDFFCRFRRVAAIDGLFMATQYDLPWRSDLFTDWHFYDISQSREFVEHGYEVVVAGQEIPWLVHDCGVVNLDNSYFANMEIFKKHYQW